MNVHTFLPVASTLENMTNIKPSYKFSICQNKVHKSLHLGKSLQSIQKRMPFLAAGIDLCISDKYQHHFISIPNNLIHNFENIGNRKSKPRMYYIKTHRVRNSILLKDRSQIDHRINNSFGQMNMQHILTHIAGIFFLRYF